jgi:hypothetical protein
MQFQKDLRCSKLFTAPEESADGFAHQLESVVLNVLDKHCPLQIRTKFASISRDCRRLSAVAVQAKCNRRRLEMQWRTTKNEVCYVAYRKACRAANKAIIDSMSCSYRERVEAAQSDPRRRWAAIRDVLHQTESPDILPNEECQRLCDGFTKYFIEKIQLIKAAMQSKLADFESIPLQFHTRHSGCLLTQLSPPSITEVCKLIRSMPAKSSATDKIPTSVIKASVEIFATLISRLTALSFKEGLFPAQFKIASVTPLLKKKGLDRAVFANYRPISNLNTISKIIERIVMSKVITHVEHLREEPWRNNR